MAYWIFKCNPDLYRLSDRLADPNDVLTWTVGQHKTEIGPGDVAFLWITGAKRGIRAIMRIDDSPRVRPELETEQTYWSERDTQERLRVGCTLTRREVDLDHRKLRDTPGLENLSVFHGFQQGTNFPVTSQEAEILLGLLDGPTLK